VTTPEPRAAAPVRSTHAEIVQGGVDPGVAVAAVGGHRPGCTVAIPRKGQPGPARRAVEHRRSFRRPVKWRTGSEGRIAHFKRRSSWDRTLLDGLTDARITHNLTKVSALAA
jgi:hypothetical protein